MWSWRHSPDAHRRLNVPAAAPHGLGVTRSLVRSAATPQTEHPNVPVVRSRLGVTARELGRDQHLDPVSSRRGGNINDRSTATTRT